MDSEGIRDFCEFGEDRVYILMAIARKKENEELTSSGEVVFREVLKDEQDIERKMEKLENACNGYGEAEKFRLYLSVNARNVVDTYFNYKNRMNDWMKMRYNGNEEIKRKFKRVDSNWKSELQKDENRDETHFIFDLDEATENEKDSFLSTLKDHTDLIKEIETPNGYHLVTDTFNYNEMDTEIDYELKTDDMIFIRYLE